MALDDELLTAWREGDQDAGNTLLDRHFDALYRFFWNKVAEPDDLVQQTLLACVAGVDRINPGGSFRAYLFGVARNRLRAAWKETYRERSRLDFGTVSAVDIGPSPSQAAVDRYEYRLLLHALRSICIDDQMILELRYWEGMSGAMLASIMGIPEGTVRSRLGRAKRALEAKVRALEAVGDCADTTHSGLETWAQGLREYADRDLGSKARVREP